MMIREDRNVCVISGPAIRAAARRQESRQPQRIRGCRLIVFSQRARVRRYGQT
jgi:hypothetical protein